MKISRLLAACALCLPACLGNPALAGGLDQAKSALAALDAKEYPSAIAQLTEAMDSNELPAEQAHLFLAARGYARSALGDYNAAIEDYSKAVQLDASYVAAVYNRGTAHFALRQYDQAIDDYSLALETDANDAKLLNNRGSAWFKKGNLQSAMANFSLAIEASPDDPDLYLNRGKVYEALGEPDKAREDFLQVKKLDSSAKTPLD